MKSLGVECEEIAAGYLRKKGYKILLRNYRTPVGEADIVMRDRDAVVFVEVKARTCESFGQPFEAVNHRKKEKLRKVALYYLKQNKIEAPVRFDVVSIISKNGRNEINHIVEAF